MFFQHVRCTLLYLHCGWTYAVGWTCVWHAHLLWKTVLLCGLGTAQGNANDGQEHVKEEDHHRRINE